MQISTTAQYIPLNGVREGNRYAILVTGADTAVTLEFQHVVDGAWFPYPAFTNTPVAGVIAADVICTLPRMRLKLATAPQATEWTATWVKQTSEQF